MSAASQVTSTVRNAEASAVLQGSIVRISAPNAAIRAQANSAANVTGLLGVSYVGANPGVSYPAVLAGDVPVLMEAGLTLAAGNPIFVSATQAGRGTNVAPGSNVRPIGWVRALNGYATTGRVSATLTASNPPAANGGALSVTMTLGPQQNPQRSRTIIGLVVGGVGAQDVYLESLVGPAFPNGVFNADFATGVGIDELPSVVPAGNGPGAPLTATANGVLTFPGVGFGWEDLLGAGQVLLVRSFTGVNGVLNGLYGITDLGSAGTPFVLTRSSQQDQVSEFFAGSSAVDVNSGLYKDVRFVLDAAPTQMVPPSSIVYTTLDRFGSFVTLTTGIFMTGEGTNKAWIRTPPSGAFALTVSSNPVGEVLVRATVAGGLGQAAALIVPP